MAWNYTTRDVPFLRDYAAASEYEAQVKPIRGRKVETKPLGNRKKPYQIIYRTDDGSIVAGYEYRGMSRAEQSDGQQAMVIYRPNGEIIVRGNYQSTSLSVQARLLGTHITTRYGADWIMATAPGEDGGDVHNGWWPIRQDDQTRNPQHTSDNYNVEPYWLYDLSKSTTLRRDSDGVLRYVNPVYRVVHKLKRAEFNAALKEYGDFVRFARGVTKLYGVGEGIDPKVPADIFGLRDEHAGYNKQPVSVYQINFPKFTPVDVLLMAQSSRADRWRALAVWAHYSPDIHSSNWWHAVKWDPTMVEKRLRQALLAVRRDTLLTREACKTGKIVKDPNPMGRWQ